MGVIERVDPHIQQVDDDVWEMTGGRLTGRVRALREKAWEHMWSNPGTYWIPKGTEEFGNMTPSGIRSWFVKLATRDGIEIRVRQTKDGVYVKVMPTAEPRS